MYKIKYDQSLYIGQDRKSVMFSPNKKNAMKTIRRTLSRFPYVKASLQKKTNTGKWNSVGTFKYKKDSKTGKWVIK